LNFITKLSFEFNYRVLSRRLRIKDICGSDHLTNQEQHLALEMPTSETAHTRREREKTPTKQQHFNI
jgi:hypothetical protein